MLYLQEEMESAQKPRIELIDAFRGVAIIAVMLFHYLFEWRKEIDHLDAVASWASVGALGVELFFVISGLVITMTILGSRSVIDFAVKRVARLYPAFAVASL